MPETFKHTAILADVHHFRALFLLTARPGGLEPPTSGFGDLRSTN